MVEIPSIVQRLDGNVGVLKVMTYVVDEDVSFLCGLDVPFGRVT